MPYLIGDEFMSVQILTDSTSYIDEATKSNLNIHVVSLNVSFENQSFKENEIDNTTFYDLMEKQGIPISSQPSIDDIYKQMEAAVKSNSSMLCIFLSSKMSGTFATAHIAKNMILERFNDAKIEIIDSMSNSMQLGFAAIVAARAALQNKSIETVKQIALDNMKRSRFLFIPDNLVYLKKGGRIGGAGALIGNILKIIPILTVEKGVTTIFSKVRTKKKATLAMLDKFLQDVKNYGLGEVVVHHINCYDEAKALANMISEKLNIAVNICDIGAVIGLHVGPGAIGIVYYTEKDLREI